MFSGIYLFLYLFMGASFFCAFMSIYSKNTVHSVLYLILCFCNSTGVLLLLNVAFLAMVYIIVYVGAIAVLFLFVVMMLNLKLVELRDEFVEYSPIVVLLLGAIVFSLSGVLEVFNYTAATISSIDPFMSYFNHFSEFEVDSIQAFCDVLFFLFSSSTIVTALILFVALYGTLVLALSARASNKRQDIFEQVDRKINIS